MKKFFKQNIKSILVVVIGIPVVAAFGWYRVNALHKSQQPSLAASSTPVSTSSTSTTIGLTGRTYQPGDCVTWSTADNGPSERVTHVVNCNTPHLFEYVSTFDLTWGKTFPTEQEWDSISDSNCKDPVNKYLGYALDPAGKFGASVIHPSEGGWIESERTVQCGIQLTRSPDNQSVPDYKLAPITGKVQGQDQTYLLTVGNCYATDPNQTKSVPCDVAHNYQISGNITLSVKAWPATDSQWNSAVGNKCEATSASYAGGKIPAGLQAGWLKIGQSGWNTGSRTVQCILGKYDTNGNLVQTTLSATPH